MKIYEEKALRNFEFWSGAIYRTEVLTPSDFDTIEAMLEEAYPEGMEDTKINDLFWFEEDTIAKWLGFYDFGDLELARKIGADPQELDTLRELWEESRSKGEFLDKACGEFSWITPADVSELCTVWYK